MNLFHRIDCEDKITSFLGVENLIAVSIFDVKRVSENISRLVNSYKATDSVKMGSVLVTTSIVNLLCKTSFANSCNVN